MSRPHAEVLICGAGIAGISAAYHLAVRRGVRGVVLVDEAPPLTVTSDKSTECYRNWWPGPGEAMVRLMDRSIDGLEELALASGNAFALNRNGYAYFTARPETARAFEEQGREISRLGAGPLRVVRGEAGDPELADAELPPMPWSERASEEELRRREPGVTDGADLVLDRDWIRWRFPFLADDVVAMLRPRRCGWLSAQQLGMWLLEQAREHGVQEVRGRVAEVDTSGGRMRRVRVEVPGGDERWEVAHFVNAAGPHLASVGRLLDVDLPVGNELHAKATFTDSLGVLPRELPLMVWNDPIRLEWSEEERAMLEEDRDLGWLQAELPGGLHFRPEGGHGSRAVLGLWAYHVDTFDPPSFPPPLDPLYAQVVLEGMVRMVPALAPYKERIREPWVDGGYYCKTRENRPLIGPLPVEGAWVLGALSGYGIMASQGAAEILADRLTGETPPTWSDAFLLERYEDPAYRRLLESWDAGAGEL